jgi:hypothetical protein
VSAQSPAGTAGGEAQAHGHVTWHPGRPRKALTAARSGTSGATLPGRHGENACGRHGPRRLGHCQARSPVPRSGAFGGPRRRR